MSLSNQAIYSCPRIGLSLHSTLSTSKVGFFPVASNPVIDLGEDDEPDMVRAMIKFMYGGRYIDYSRLPSESVVEAMVEMFILADKYDVERLRVSVCNHFTRAMDVAFSDVGKNITHQHRFITSIVPRICGPSALQLADQTLRQSILDLCKVHWSTLLLDPDFCTLYGTGQLFDGDHALEFGRHLQLLLDNSDKKVRLEFWCPVPESCIEESFEAFYDLRITYGSGQTFFTHKILVSIHSVYLNDMLGQSLDCHCIALDREDDPNLITTMLHEIHDPDYLVKPHDWAAYNADMCALTQKYGLEDSNFRHRFVFLDTMNKEKRKSSYPLAVALVCGPDSSEYADTKLPEQVSSGVSTMKSDAGLAAQFFDNEKYSDVIIKFGERQVRAHKVILAQQSGYFAAAFFGLFQVASNPVVDLGDEDDPALLTNVIKYLYWHGPIHDYDKDPDRLSMDQLVDVYLLADKYDIQGLRRRMAAEYYRMASNDLRKLRQNSSYRSIFVEHIARICGPSCFQLADDTLQVLVRHLYQLNISLLFKNEIFLQHYIKGELFDKEHAAAFGIQLGKSLLRFQNKTHEEADRLSKSWESNLIGNLAMQRNTKNFFNDQRFSDVRITYGIGQILMAHKVVLASHSHEFQTMLACSPEKVEIDLRNEPSSTAVTTFIKDMYVSEFPDPDIKRDPSVFAELVLLSNKHGRKDVTDTYLRRFEDAMWQEPFLDRYILDYVIIVVLAILFLAIDKIDGFRQHFALQNYTLQYPYAVHERVPAGICYIIVVICPAIIICFWTLVIDGLFAHSQPTDAEGTGRRLGRYRLVDRLWELNCGILGLALSEGTAFVITGTLKNTVGSFAGLFYLSLYLAAKLHIWDSRGEVWKIFVVIIPSLGATLIAASRIMDARHHPFDVIVGSLLGIACAWLSYRQYFPPVTETWRKGRAYPIRTWGQETAPPPAAMSTAYEP
ncbi:hypothetical protein KCU64_g12074, partial [Aureobasidium melanogenum]